jgi:uncharacterized protein
VRWAQRLEIALIQAYRMALAPMLGPACRYEPSCSSYAIEAIERFGVAGGSWRALRRVIRCNPLGGSGPDPVQ